jgi:hypothetical protein
VTLLSREQILGASDRKTEDVEVPEWGGTVRVRSLSGSERDAYEAGIVQLRGDGSRKFTLENARARLVSLALCGEDGERLFSDADIAELGKKSAAALERVFDKARHLSGLSEDDVEELAQGFERAPSGASTSA